MYIGKIEERGRDTSNVITGMYRNVNIATLRYLVSGTFPLGSMWILLQIKIIVLSICVSVNLCYTTQVY